MKEELWRSLFFGTKDSLKKKKKQQKNKTKTHVFSKSTFFFYSFQKTEQVEDATTLKCRVLKFFCLFKLDKVSFCQVQRPFQNKTCYCEATLIKKTQEWETKKNKHFLSSDSCPRVQVDTMLQQTARYSADSERFSSPNLVCGKSCKFNNKLMACFIWVQFTCWMK